MAVHYRFGSFELNPAGRRLLRHGEAVSLQPKAFDLLVYLVERHGELLSKDQLLDEVWSGTFVTENSLTRCAHLVRLVLEDDPDAPRYLETVPRAGYRFIADVAADPASVGRDAGLRRWRVLAVLLVPLVGVIALSWWWLQSPPQHSIAVLAFENMSGDPEQEYFSDGISDELLNVLAKIPGLTVISRSSAFSFKGKDAAIPEIAEQLNVAHVLEGSVRRDGNRVRITAQLIEASSDSHLWSETYDRDFVDIFAVQEEIAGAISEALKIELVLVGGEPVQPIVIRSASMDAYDAYLRGRELVYRREHLDEAIRHLERSLRLDETFAPAHAQLAIAIGLSAPTLEEARRRAIPHLDRAQELAPDLAEAHGGRALLARYGGDPESTIEHAQRALASNPNYVDAMNWLQGTLPWVGRNEEGIAILEQMLVIDPLNVVGRFNYGWYLGRIGQVAEAHEMADQLLAQSKSMGYGLHALTLFSWEGKIAEGLSWTLRAWAEDPSVPYGYRELVSAYIWIGEYGEARRLGEDTAYLVDIAEGRFEEAIRATARKMQLSPGSPREIIFAAHALYEAGRIDKALPLYESLFDFVPEGVPIYGTRFLTMRLAMARRKMGDEDGAQSAADIVRKDLLRLATQPRTSGVDNQELRRERAMVAAFEQDPERVITELKSAVQLGLRNPQVFRDPIFENMWDDPRFIAVQKNLDAILAAEHDKVLQLICFNNPTPEHWQPLPETCEGVVKSGYSE